MSSESRPRVVFVVIAHTQYDNWEELKDLRSAVDALVHELGKPGTGYELLQRRLMLGGTRREVEDGLTNLTTELRDKDRLVLYWTGHGVGDGHHYLVTKESPRYALSSLTAIRADVLGEVMAKTKAEKILVLVDTCYSSEGARLIAEEVGRILGSRTVASDQVPFVAVIPSAHSAQKAEAGVFCRALSDVLTGTDPALRLWTDHDELIGVDDLRDSLLSAMRAAMGPGWQPPLPTSNGYGSRFLPNPRHRCSPAVDVETSRRLLQIPETLVLAARGIEAGDAGWYFTPRKVIGRLVAWLQEPGAGISALTGSPGAGKSAVLGRLLLLSDATFRAQDRPEGSTTDASDGALPPPGFVDAALHARGKTAEQCGRLIASQLDLPIIAEPGTFDGRTLVNAIAARQRRAVIVIDALDESTEPFAVAALVGALAAQGGARVCVGTRRSLAGRIVGIGEDRHAPLRLAFGPDALIVDLDDEPDTRADIAAYVTARLLDSRHRDNRETIAKVARLVADVAQGSFLYARVVSRTLQAADHLEGRLPTDQLDAFVSDLHTRFAERLAIVDSVLAALAWSAGNGVSRAAWPDMATAVSQGQPACSHADVSWVLDHAGWHILEAQESGQTVYRLVHQAFADYYRTRATDPVVIHRRIALKFAEGVSGLDWLNADPYLHRHLAEHAGQGGVLDALVQDIGYLVIAEPTHLLPRLNTLQDPTARRFAALYRRALDLLLHASRVDRMAVLQLAAQQEEPALAPRLRPLLRPRWQSRWAYWRRTVPSTLVMALDPRVNAAALVDIQQVGATIVCAQGTDLRAVVLGSAVQGPWTVHIEGGSVTGLVCLDVGGTTFVVAADDRGYLHACRFSSSDVITRVLAHAKCVRGITVFNELEPPLIATCGDDGEVALWTFPELQPLARQKVMELLTSVVAARVDNRPVVVVAGDTYPEDDAGLPAASMWSVPELQRLATFDVPTSIDHLNVVTVGQQPVVFGSRYGRVKSWLLPSGRLLPIHDGTDVEVHGDYFLAHESDGVHTTVIVKYGGTLRRLTLSRRRLALTPWRPDLSVEVTPWIEAAPGVWLGPVALWGRHYLISVHRELRLWDLDDLLAAIDAAPRTDAEMRHQQESFGVLSIAATETIVWSGLDSGHLRALDAATGDERRTVPTGVGRPVALRTGWFKDRPCLFAGCFDGVIHRLDAGTGHPLAPPIQVGGKVTDIAVFSSTNGGFLAATTESQSEKGRQYHVRLWNMASGEEIDTREPDEDRLRRKFGADVGWLLSIQGYEKEKPLKAVTFLSSRERLLVAAGGDPVCVGVWDVARFEPVVTCRPPAVDRKDPNVVSLAQLAADRELMLVAGTDTGAIVAWELTAGKVLWTRQSGQSDAQVAAVQWGGRLALASGGWDGVFRLWSPDGEPVDHVRLGVPIWSIVGLPDGAIAVGTNRGLIVLGSM